MDFAALSAGYSNEVENVSFAIFDIDDANAQFLDQVIVTAYDADGNIIPTTTILGSNTTLTSTTNPDGSVTVTSVAGSGGGGTEASVTGYA